MLLCQYCVKSVDENVCVSPENFKTRQQSSLENKARLELENVSDSLSIIQREKHAYF